MVTHSAFAATSHPARAALACSTRSVSVSYLQLYGEQSRPCVGSPLPLGAWPASGLTSPAIPNATPKTTAKGPCSEILCRVCRAAA
jgi:hypothetical protein